MSRLVPLLALSLVSLSWGREVPFPSFSLQAAGHSWNYSYQAPERVLGRLPLVLLLHGTGGSPRYCLDDAGWAPLARSQGFLAVAPEGLPFRPDEPADTASNPRMWAVRQNSPRAQIDDLAFFDALLADVQRRWQVDPQRIYCVGHSNGAEMTFKLALARPDRFAAIAPVSGLCWEKGPPLAHPIPTLYLIGTQDLLYPMAGGATHTPWGDRSVPAVAENLAGWARILGYSGQPLSSGTGGIRFGPDFEAIFIADQGHNWPGGRGGLSPQVAGPNGGHLDATARIWQFLKAHHR